MTKNITMRDALIEEIYMAMNERDDIFFLSADFGSPVLDKIRNEFCDRFISVGIAEQNLVNIATGLALEGYVVYAYAISAFLSMRSFEQVRTNLALLSQLKEMNVNLIGVGAGLSYDVSGPTHHCLEDLAVMNLLPNITLISPSDWHTAAGIAGYTMDVKRPKYIRLDAKPLPPIYGDRTDIDLEKGFSELRSGKDVCMVSTGYMTHRALEIADKCSEAYINCGVVDVYMIKPVNAEKLAAALCKYDRIVVLEEAFVGKGGLDATIINILSDKCPGKDIRALGFKDRYIFELGPRKYLHEINGLGDADIINIIKDEQ